MAKFKTDKTHLAATGRILISLIFVISGCSKLLAWNQVAGYMASKGIPLVPFFLAMSTAVEIVAGLALLLGFRTRVAAALLILYLIPVTLVMHNFWAVAGMERQMQLVNFLKNLAILGGLFQVANYGAGSASVDNRHRAMDERIDIYGKKRLRSVS